MTLDPRKRIRRSVIMAFVVSKFGITILGRVERAIELEKGTYNLSISMEDSPLNDTRIIVCRNHRPAVPAFF